jgi:isopentenyl-diphosphate delta-isomerase
MSDSAALGDGAMARKRPSEPLVVRIEADGSAGGPIARTIAHQSPGVLHLAVSLQVVDLTHGRWLLQRRAASKALFPNRWANTCCTHPAPGEDPARAAVRRVRQEIGLVVEDLVAAGSFTYHATDPLSGFVEYEHDFVFVATVDTGPAEADPNEISALALLPFEDAIDLLQSDAGAPWAADVVRRSQAALSAGRVARGDGDHRRTVHT